jgi:hypothetical protein
VRLVAVVNRNCRRTGGGLQRGQEFLVRPLPNRGLFSKSVDAPYTFESTDPCQGGWVAPADKWFWRARSTCAGFGRLRVSPLQRLRNGRYRGSGNPSSARYFRPVVISTGLARDGLAAHVGPDGAARIACSLAAGISCGADRPPSEPRLVFGIARSQTYWIKPDVWRPTPLARPLSLSALVYVARTGYFSSRAPLALLDQLEGVERVAIVLGREIRDRECEPGPVTRAIRNWPPNPPKETAATAPFSGSPCRAPPSNRR